MDARGTGVVRPRFFVGILPVSDRLFLSLIHVIEVEPVDALEKLKLEAIQKATREKGKKLTGLEALAIEKRVAQEYQGSAQQVKKDSGDPLPLSRYRFD